MVNSCSLKLSSFSQNKIPICGEIKLRVTIADTEYYSTFIITDLLDTEFLIGDPFLRQSGASIDYKENVLRLSEGKAAPFKLKPKNVSETVKIRCNKIITIPSNSMQYIEGKIPAICKRLSA